MKKKLSILRENRKIRNINFHSHVFLFIILLILTNHITAAKKTPPKISPKNKNVISESDKLINQRKYYSAFKKLTDADLEFINPDIQIKKVEVAINYFTASINHTIFGFKDLEKDEDIMEIRRTGGESTMLMFDVPKVFEKLIKNNPKNYKLHKALGEYYYDVSLRYQGRWLLSDKEIVNLYQKNLTLAYENNVFDYKSVHTIGEGYLLVEKYKEAKPYLLKSIELKPEYSTANYNMGVACYFTGDKNGTVKYVKKAYKLYKDKGYKTDAAKLLGTAYGDLNKPKKSVYYFRIANKLSPNKYKLLKPLLELELQLGDKKKIKNVTQDLFELAPKNPAMYNELIGIYKKDNKLKSLIKFLFSNIKKYAEDELVHANLYFHIGLIYSLENDKQNSKKYLLKSKKYFLKAYKPDHQVFKAIESHLKKDEK
jgi:tetratricopeptide (TPR) repeat protein